MSKVEVGGEIFLPGFIRDISERRRRQEEREALLREQAARAEAERVAEMVSGMQLLVDAALAHRTLDDIVADLVTRVRAVLGADAATIYLSRRGRAAWSLGRHRRRRGRPRRRAAGARRGLRRHAWRRAASRLLAQDRGLRVSR